MNIIATLLKKNVFNNATKSNYQIFRLAFFIKRIRLETDQA